MYYKERANLAEFSYKLCEKMVKKAFLDTSTKLPYHMKIILYCFLHKGISSRQTSIIFGNSDNQKNTIHTVLYRIIKKGNIRKFIYGTSNETGYYITPKGIREASTLVKDFINSNMSDENLSYDNQDFTLNEIIEYLSNRCAACKPKYWQHYLATRDIFAYLISGKMSDNIFHYEIEVGIEETGRTASLYTRSLLGLDLKYQIRSDGMLTLKKFDSAPPMFRFFIEVDNGSQSSSVVVDKVTKYIKNYVQTREFKTTTSVMFCINTETVNEKPLRKCKDIISSTTDYYYGLLLVNVYDLLITIGVEFKQSATIEEIVAFIESRNNDKHSDAMYQVTRYFRSKTSLFKGHMPINDLHNIYKEMTVKKQTYKNDERAIRNKKKYLDRRSLIHNSIIDIPGIYEAFLKGFSLYTVSNYDLDNTLPYINIEMTKMKCELIGLLMKYNLINCSDDIVYKAYIFFRKSNILLCNFYYHENQDKGIIIENISDDLGGFYRVKNLLESDEIPSYMLSNVLLLCICDSNSVNNLKLEFLETKQGKKLFNSCNNYTKDCFEILFITYEEIYKGLKPFSFSSAGEIIYKEKPLIQDTKGYGDIF